MRQKVSQLRIAVVGATGATGRQVMSIGLARGHQMVALVRRSESFDPQERLTESVWADIADPSALAAALSGVDVVISVIGGASRGPTHVCSEAVSSAVTAMAAGGVARLIAVSAHGALESHDRSLYSLAVWVGAGERMKDKEAMERVITESSLDWTIVRPPTLKDETDVVGYVVGDDLPIRVWDSIGRASLADFLVREAEDSNFLHRYPRIHR